MLPPPTGPTQPPSGGGEYPGGGGPSGLEDQTLDSGGGGGTLATKGDTNDNSFVQAGLDNAKAALQKLSAART